MTTDGYNYADFAEHVADGGLEIFEWFADRRAAGHDRARMGPRRLAHHRQTLKHATSATARLGSQPSWSARSVSAVTVCSGGVKWPG